MSTVAEKKKEAIVAPFVIEAKHPRNCDIAIQSLDIILRGSVSAVVELFDKQLYEDDFDEGKETRPQGAKLVPGIGEIPGMQLQVDPAGLRWKSVDPLCKDEKRMDRIQRALRRAIGVNVSERLRGMPSKEGRVDIHRMKTLCRELLCLIKSGEIRVIKGSVPAMENVDKLPGRYLLNAANTQGWHQPRFEDQYESWVDRMSQIGGD